MEQDRTPYTVRFLRDPSPDKCQGDEDGKKDVLVHCVGHSQMQNGEHKSDQEAREELAKKRFQFAQEQSPVEDLLKRCIGKDKD